MALMRDAEMQKWMDSRGAEARTSSPAEFRAYIRKDLEKWSRVVKAVNISVE